MTTVCLAIDVGGSKIRAALVDRAGILVRAESCPTDAARGAPAVVGHRGRWRD
jgi:predicted NBD/HSP70 family sugar kinase